MERFEFDIRVCLINEEGGSPFWRKILSYREELPGNRVWLISSTFSLIYTSIEFKLNRYVSDTAHVELVYRN